MVILKLVAWSDRPEERDNDPFDILFIIRKYFDIEYDDVFDNHYDAFPDGGNAFDQLQIAARVLGRKSAAILAQSEKLKERILNVLQQNTLNPADSPIAKQWATKHGWTLDYASQLLLELKAGIEETLSAPDK